MISSVSWVSSSTRPPPLDGNDTAARRSHRDKRNLIRVLKATKTGPRRGPQHPAVSRPPTITGFRRQRATSPFSPEPGVPQGTQGLLAGLADLPVRSGLGDRPVKVGPAVAAGAGRQLDRRRADAL